MPGLRMRVIAAVTILQLMMSPTMSEPKKCDFVKIAQDFIAKEYPFIDLHAAYRHPLSSESNTFWEMRYELPPDALGFVPVVVIDKWTCKVVHAHVEQ